MEHDRYTVDDLLCLLDGALPRQKELAIRKELERSETLRAELERLEVTRKVLVSAAEDGAASVLKPFFTDRMMRRLNAAATRPAAEEEVASMLIRLFRPVAVVCLVLAVCLAVYNINIANDYTSDTTTTEAILALPPVNSMSVYELDVYAPESVTLP